MAACRRRQEVGKAAARAGRSCAATGLRSMFVSIYSSVSLLEVAIVFSRFWLSYLLFVHASQILRAADFFLPSVAKSALQHPVGNILAPFYCYRPSCAENKSIDSYAFGGE
jgi:hypothetical protein